MASGTVDPRVLVQVTGDELHETEFARRIDVGDAGAVVTFSGRCRSEDGRLSALELEHYPGMVERRLHDMAAEILERHRLNAIGVAHRYGVVPVGGTIVVVVAAASHRQAAFDGANRLMDYLKTNAPFWKKEHRADGRPGEWIDERAADRDARARWER